jgi:pyridoxal phosphate enzyme (YggS family)
VTVASRYALLREEIDAELRACGREAGSVTVVGVAKRQPLQRIRQAIEAGLCDIGENRLQEAQRAFPALPPVRKHFIGHVQTNKAKGIAALFDLVQSVDRLEAGVALAKAAAGLGRVLPVLIQVNVSAAERFGCRPDEAPELATRLRTEASLRVEGVMAMAPLDRDPTVVSASFEAAAKTLALVGGSTLSIGMSSDWREAVRAGSTMVRIGTALFGEREGK